MMVAVALPFTFDYGAISSLNKTTTPLQTIAGTAGYGIGEVHSIDISVDVGFNSNYKIQAQIHISEKNNELGAKIYSPAVITPWAIPDKDFIRDSDGTFIQSRMSDTLVNRVNFKDHPGYELDFYKLNQVSAKPNEQGLYTINPGEQPFVIWQLEDPDPHGSKGNHLLVTWRSKVDQAGTVQWDYQWADDFEYHEQKFSGWKLITTDNGKELSAKGVYRRSDMVDGQRIETKIALEINPDGTVATEQVTKADSTGQVISEEDVAEPSNVAVTGNVATDQNANHVTTRAYNQNHDVIMEKDWTGHWTYIYEYANDAYHSRAKYVEQYKNNLYTGKWPDNENRMFDTVFDSQNSVYTTTETLQGTVVHRHWKKLEKWGHNTDLDAKYACKIIEADATNASAITWDDPTNLLTVTYIYDQTDPATGQLQGTDFLVVRSDQTATLTRTYDDKQSGNITKVVENGHLASGPTPENPYSAVIDQGTRTTTITDNRDNDVSTKTVDIASNLTIADRQITAKDEFQRPTQFVNFPGTPGSYTELQSDDSSRTDRYGITYLTANDALHRLTDSMAYANPPSNAPPSVETHYKYDAAGRQTAISLGSGDRQLVQFQNAYNKAGEITSSTDETGQVTKYSTALDKNGFVERTTIHPDGSTSIEICYQDGTTYRKVGTAEHGVQHAYGVATDGSGTEFSSITPLDDNGQPVKGATITEWMDFNGNRWKTVSPSPTGSGTVSTEYHYDYPSTGYPGTGRLSKISRTGLPDTVYSYDLLGQIAAVGQGSSNTSLTGQGGKDGLVATEYRYVLFSPPNGSPTVAQQVSTRTWITGQASSLTVETTAVDGSGSWITTDGLTTSRVVSSNPAEKTTTMTTTLPDGTQTIIVKENGRVSRESEYSADHVLVSQTSYTYDSYGRLVSETPTLGQSISYSYDSAGNRLTQESTTPNKPREEPLVLTSQNTLFDQTQGYGRRIVEQIHVGNATGSVLALNTCDYYPTGEVRLVYGSNEYPTGYAYDYAGRLIGASLWQDFDLVTGTGLGKPAQVKWEYNSANLPITEHNADNNGPSYEYDEAGRLTKRQWARTGPDGKPLTTTYTYNLDGTLARINYSDKTTPSVIFEDYDRLGRPGKITDGSGTRILGYDHGFIANETYTSGTLAGAKLTRSFDLLSRITRLTLGWRDQTINDVAYEWSGGQNRLKKITWNNNSATLAYQSPTLLAGIIFANNQGKAAFATSYQYDVAGRLQQVNNLPGADASNLGANFTYNQIGLLTRATKPDGSYWSYSYGQNPAAITQLDAASLHSPTGEIAPGQDWTYAYDCAGNRRLTSINANLPNTKTILVKKYYAANGPSAPLGANALNQYNHCSEPEGTEDFTYDADGNLLSDGHWRYTWDAENRLIKMNALNRPGSSALRSIAFGYDGQNRIVSREIYVGSGSSPAEKLLYLYNGPDLLAEIDAISRSPVLLRSYAWLPLAADEMVKAAGSGRLCMASFHNGTTAQTIYYGYDGQHNVSCLVAPSGKLVGNYDFDPFGVDISTAGDWALFNPFRFKGFYDETAGSGFHLDVSLQAVNGHFYLPLLGRWLSPDQNTPEGHRIVNPYVFLNNNLVNY